MQTTVKKVSDKPRTKQTPRTESTTTRKAAKEEDAVKKTPHNVTTPRNYLPKTSTSDIYKQNRNVVHSARAPKKVVGTTHSSSNATPSKDYLKSSPSSISQISNRSQLSTKSQVSSRSVYDKSAKNVALKSEANAMATNSARRTPRTAKVLPFVNVTVNSPVARRKLNMDPSTQFKAAKEIVKDAKMIETKNLKIEKAKTKEGREVARKNLDRGDFEDINERQRSKTRTLDEKEVKVLAPVVNNNVEMQNLAQKLTAKPKAFYVEIQQGNTKITEKQSDEEVSYEDDFESYESDFESYHSDQTTATSHSKTDESDSVDNENDSDRNEESGIGGVAKECKDDEKMLDSGSFDLRDRSATKYKPKAMEFIMEDSEDDKKPSFTDEGFQDMSSSSAVSSMKHIDVLDRPMFIDFTKSKETKRKRRINEKLQQRAKDLLAMITLHKMSYTMFEMKPIPYDLYMATFGRSNYTQIAVQTFDDGVTEEIQTEEILFDHKWTQHPIEFSKNDVYIYPNDNKNNLKNNEDYLTKFTLFINSTPEVEFNNKTNLDKNYKDNPLRIYFEQKDGVGASEMLPYENYKKKIENNDYNVNKLRKFLKKMERKVSNILRLNSGDRKHTDLTKSSKLPFSKGYCSIHPKTIDDDRLKFLKHTKISNLIFSETKNTLIMSIHKKPSNNAGDRCVICMWDFSVASPKPVKVLVAIYNVTIGRFKGNNDGFFVGALEDGSLHLWDLSEEPTWRNDTSAANSTNLVEVEGKTKKLTQTEIDREWNLKNSKVGKEQLLPPFALQACSYTSSAGNMESDDVTDAPAGLEFVGEAQGRIDGGMRVLGQVCLLQRIGILTIFSIIQEKKPLDYDLGKAYWSKMRLEKAQIINLLHHVDIPIFRQNNDEIAIEFNFNAAKRRLSNRKLERSLLKKDPIRPKSTSSSEFDISRPASAASSKKVLPLEKKVHENWESGLLCCDLKIMKVEKRDTYLVAKNNGEVLCCTKFGGAVKVDTFCVTPDTSTIISLDVSPHGLPYFLAATDSGTVNLCSLADARVLLTLDCRNIPSASVEADKCVADSKGRFVSSAKVKSHAVDYSDLGDTKKPTIASTHWSPSNPCVIYTALTDATLVTWDLSHSDICARGAAPATARRAAAAASALALVTPEDEIQVHRLGSEPAGGHQLDLFLKYVTLL